MEYDLFICHATEDKEKFVRPLANILKNEGVRVWYDEFCVSIGESLSETIDRGLASSNYGLVVLSHNFFKKHWTRRELGGLIAREGVEKRRILLPILFGITYAELVRRSPILSDIVGLVFNDNMNEIASTILRKLDMENPYTQLGGRQLIDIFDKNGAEAKWTLERTLRVNREPLKSIEVRVSSDGEVTNVAVSPGVLRSIRRDGGVNMLVIDYPTPLAVGYVYTQSVILDVRDMFRFRTAQGRIVPSLPYNEYQIVVHLPEPNLPKEIHAFKQVGKTRIPLPGLSVNTDKTDFSVRIEKLEPGTLYELAWIWDVENPRDELSA